jgi:hypothetical protein
MQTTRHIALLLPHLNSSPKLLSMNLRMLVLLALAVFAGTNRATAQANQDNAQSAGSVQQPEIQPQKGQSPQEQKKDISDCYDLAKSKTGIDPSALSSLSKDKAAGAASAAGANTGGAMGQVAEAAGAQSAQDQSTTAAAGAAQPSADVSGAASPESKMDTFKMADQACLKARGYIVKSSVPKALPKP